MLKKKLSRRSRIQKYLYGMLLLTLFLNSNGIHAATLEPAKNKNSNSFTGKVTPILSALVRYGFNDLDRGIVTYSTRPGQFVYGPTLDSTGKIITKGSLLIKLSSNYHKQEVEAAAANIKLAKADMVLSTINYKRAIQLGEKTKVISMQDYDLYVSQYKEAIANLEGAKEALITAQSLYDLIHLRAAYDGIVTKVYMAGALLNNEPPVLQLGSLNPMGVKIELDHSIAKKLNNMNNSVKVYPVRGDKQATGILANMTKLTNDGIMLAVENYLVSPKLDKQNTPIVYNTQPVLRLYTSDSSSKQLAIPIPSLIEDSNGTYVWQLVGNKDAQAKKGLSNLYTAKKTYITLGQLIKRINNHIDYIVLDNTNNLSQYDLVLINDKLPTNLNDNTEVCLADNKYLFMPGDEVKIEVSK